MDNYDRLYCDYSKEEYYRVLRKGFSEFVDFDCISVQMLELLAAFGCEIEVDGDLQSIYISYYGRI